MREIHKDNTKFPYKDDDIVALYINGEIYLGLGAIDKAIEIGKVDGVIKREIFNFMAEFDLDKRWKDYSKYPTILTWDEFIQLK